MYHRLRGEIAARPFILGLLLALIVMAVGTQTASAALYTTVPRESDANHVLRIHDGNGNNTRFRMAIYTNENVAMPTTNPQFRMVFRGNSNCRSESRNIITVSNSSPSSIRAVCPQTVDFSTTGGWVYEADIARWRKDVVMNLSGSRESVANFRIVLLTGGFYIGYEANTARDGYAVNALNSQPTYVIEFARNPCLGASGGRVGAWDAREDVRIRLYEMNRDNSGERRIGQVTNNNDDEDDIWIDFVLNPNKKYRLEVRMSSDDDTIAIRWPEDTVYAAARACLRPTPSYSYGYYHNFLRLINGDIMTNGNIFGYGFSYGDSTNLAAFVGGSINGSAPADPGLTTSNNGVNGGGGTQLTFANTTGGWGGGFGGTYSVPLGFWNPPPGVTAQAGPYTYNQSRCNDTGLVYVTGNVYINGNVGFRNPSHTGSTVGPPPVFGAIEPCGVIASGHIFISPGVTSLNGTYATRRNLYTCAPNGSTPSPAFVRDNCNNTLTVRGSLIAEQRVFPLRIAALTYAIRETVTYGPEIWLQSISNTTTPSPASEYKSVTSLPPIL